MGASQSWVGVDNGAAHLGVGKSSVYRWIEQRGLAAHRAGQLYRFKPSEIDERVRNDNEQEKITNPVQIRPSSKTQANRSTPKDTFTEEGRK